MNLPCAELSIVGSWSITLALLAPPLFYVVRCLYILPALLCHLYQWNIAQTNVEPKSLLKLPFLWIKVLLSLTLPITWIGKIRARKANVCFASFLMAASLCKQGTAGHNIRSMQSCRPSCVSRNSVRNSWRICAKDLTNCWLWNRKAPVSFCGVYEAKLEYHYEACAAVNIFLPSTPLYQQISRHLSEKSIVCCWFF